jgi:hypothetical protein
MSDKSPTDNIGWTLGIAIMVVIAMVLLGFWLTPKAIDTTPRVGDTWEFYGTGDPFNEKEKYTRVIIGIQGEYIQFIENRKDTLTRVRSLFEHDSKLIKRKKIKKIAPITKEPAKILKDTTK